MDAYYVDPAQDQVIISIINYITSWYDYLFDTNYMEDSNTIQSEIELQSLV